MSKNKTESEAVGVGLDNKDGVPVPSDEPLRDERGLLKGVEYKFKEDGMIDWRAMIPEEFLYPNKEWFEARQQPVPKTVEGLEDKQLLVMLGGIKHVARLRGYSYVDYEWAPHSTPEHVAVKCTISFIDNFETRQGVYRADVSFSSLANASVSNMSDFVAKFPETIAENRAFVRCVRNFLNINICSDEEIDKNKGYLVSTEDTAANKSKLPNEILQKVVQKQLGIVQFSEFIAKLRALYKDGKYKPTVDAKKIGEWKSFNDIPKPEVRNIIGAISE